ncbi:hypothetical protein AB1Y20_004493 [Prymnesium parvum]|uniref:Uncharacterized protein n=1 Tax=Prymnesium parvum TaxID=97485 RepID=A0AB34IZE6_PRYPA
MSDTPPEALHVVLEVQPDGRSLFLCPECDDDRVTVPDSVSTVCTRDWLQGRLLECSVRFGARTCACWETDPYEGEEAATDRQRRFFHYVCVAILLGARGRRVDLPRCVKEQIESAAIGSGGSFLGMYFAAGVRIGSQPARCSTASHCSNNSSTHLRREKDSSCGSGLSGSLISELGAVFKGIAI